MEKDSLMQKLNKYNLSYVSKIELIELVEAVHLYEQLPTGTTSMVPIICKQCGIYLLFVNCKKYGRALVCIFDDTQADFLMNDKTKPLLKKHILGLKKYITNGAFHIASPYNANCRFLHKVGYDYLPDIVQEKIKDGFNDIINKY